MNFERLLPAEDGTSVGRSRVLPFRDAWRELAATCGGETISSA
jgi:hypothetical protein